MHGRHPLQLDPRRSRALGVTAPVREPAYAPVINPFLDRAPPPMPNPGVGGQPCSYDRMQLAGGVLNALIVHPEVVPFERLYRRLPEEGMFDPSVSPERPFAFELGAFRVPTGFNLLIFDLRPDIYRFSGLDAGDYVPVEARRFASIMGFEVTIDQRHRGNTSFQLDPVAIQTTSLQAFFPQATAVTTARRIVDGTVQPVPVGTVDTPQGAFNIAEASSFANAAGAGEALMPQRPTRYGPLSVPFTLIARASQTVQLRCVIFHPVPSPIAFIEYDLAGILAPSQWVEEMIQCAAPTYQVAR